MTDLLWPGDHRAGDIMTDAAVLDAMLRLEASWSAALADREIIPPSARVRVEQLRHLLRDNDITAIAVDAEAGGNPVIPLLAVLRPRLDAEAGRWLHRGMTSQDVVDTALMLTAREACDRVTAELAGHVELLATIVDEHRRTPMLARTLTQSAVPITFGAKAARWLDGILDALDAVNAVRFPIQLGGAAGTLSGAVELADANAETVLDAVAATAAELGLDTPRRGTRCEPPCAASPMRSSPARRPGGTSSMPFCCSGATRAASSPCRPGVDRRPCHTNPTRRCRS